MRALTQVEIENVDGASKEGAAVVLSAIMLGAAAGSVVPGVGTAVGAVAGAISAGVHAFAIWNALN